MNITSCITWGTSDTAFSTLATVSAIRHDDHAVVLAVPARFGVPLGVHPRLERFLLLSTVVMLSATIPPKANPTTLPLVLECTYG
jgi:hypothetical protein